MELELWRIGESMAAPKFNVVCKPNDWSRTITQAAKQAEAGILGEVKQLQLDFWTVLREYALDHAEQIKTTKPLPQHWMNIAIGRSGFQLTAYFVTNSGAGEEPDELRVALDITAPQAHGFFRALEEQQEDIEGELGKLIWDEKPGAKSCAVLVKRGGELQDRERWPKYAEWFTRELDKFHGALSVRVKRLVPLAVDGDLVEA